MSSSVIYIVGMTGSFGPGMDDAFLVKYGFPSVEEPVDGVIILSSSVENLLYASINILYRRSSCCN